MNFKLFGRENRHSIFFNFVQEGQNNPNHNFKSERPLACFRFIIPRGDGGIDDVHSSLSKFLTMSTEFD